MTAQRGNYAEGPPSLFVQGLYEESSVQKQKLGTVRWTDDGRKFVYCSNTAASIAAGTLLSKVQTPVDATIAAADAAINLAGVKDITLTIAGATADLYKDGYLVVKAGADIGKMYKVAGNKATNNPATGRAGFSIYEGVETLHVAANTTVAAHQNPYKNLLINPAVADENATTNESVMAMAHFGVSASMYFWAQTWGPAVLVLDVDAAAGDEANEMLIVSGTTAGRGAVIIPTETSFFWGTQVVGRVIEAADLTDAEGNLVYLTIS